MALQMCSFLNLSLRVTPRMALRQRISSTSSLRVSPDLRVHVSDAYVAMGTIRALYRRIFRTLLIFQMASQLAKGRRRYSYTSYDIFSAIWHYALRVHLPSVESEGTESPEHLSQVNQALFAYFIKT